MRIIAGQWGGRTLVAPPGKTTRPTGDRVREALFNILGPPPDNAQVLDLFAGSGALGFEALSRGAARLTAIDQAPGAIEAIRTNARTLQAEPSCTIRRTDAIRFLGTYRGPELHWVFVDPPYATELANKALDALARPGLLGSQGTVIVEHDRRRPPDGDRPSLVKTDQRQYGDTCLTFYRSAP